MHTSCTICARSLEDTKAIARVIEPFLQPNDVILLSGDLGAGKTHFTQALAESLGIEEPLTSPTFNIVLEYCNSQARLPLFHFDLYRLNHPDELDDIGFVELCESEGISCIEWADKFPESMPEDCLDIAIRYNDEGLRYFTLTARGDRWQDDFPVLASALEGMKA